MLAAIALLAQVVAPPPVEINHFFVTVDRPTWKAIQSSKWLKDEFANVSVSSHASGTDSWTGIYVSGVGSYVEIFAADRETEVGDSGIGFLTPAPGGVDVVDFLFRNGYFGKRAQRELMDLGSGGKQEPFAHIAAYDGQDPMLSIWLMEYHEEFYRKNGVPIGSTETQINAHHRRTRNRPYRKLMGDVTRLTVTRGRPDLDHALELMGFQKQANGWKRGRSEFRFAPRSSYGIAEARFSLRHRPAKRHVERFGSHCSLTIDPNGDAVWRFR